MRRSEPGAEEKDQQVDNYTLLLQASASDVTHHDGQSNGHWAGHSGPATVNPSELVSKFSSRVQQLLAEHEDGEEYEAIHWTRRLAEFDSRDDLTPQRGDVNELLMKHEKARQQSYAVLEKAVDDAEMTEMTPAQLQEELASFEAASCGLQLEAEESVAHLEANLRELQAAAPGIAQRQFGKVNAEINAELVRRNALMEEEPLEVEVPGSPGPSRSRRASREELSPQPRKAQGAPGALSSEGLLLKAVSPSSGSVLGASASRLPAAALPPSPGGSTSSETRRDEEPDWKELGLVGGSKLAIVARRVVTQVIASRNQAKRQQEESEQRERVAREQLEKQKEVRLRSHARLYLSEEAQPRETAQQTEPMHEIAISGELHAKLTEAGDRDSNHCPHPSPDPDLTPTLTLIPALSLSLALELTLRMSTQAEIEIDTLGKQLKGAQTTLKLMEPPERGRVALDAARRSLQMTEMASGHDNWSNKGSYLRSDARRHKGTSTLELEESGTKELERQLLYAKGDARQARSRMCLCLCPCLCSCLWMVAHACAPPHSVDT